MNKKLKRGVNGALVTAMAATPVLAFPMDKAHAAEDVDYQEVLNAMEDMKKIYEALADNDDVEVVKQGKGVIR